MPIDKANFWKLAMSVHFLLSAMFPYMMTYTGYCCEGCVNTSEYPEVTTALDSDSRTSLQSSDLQC